MDKLLNLEHKDRFSFKKHFLAAVHFEIRFLELDLNIVMDNKDLLSAELKAEGLTECEYIEERQITFTKKEENASPKIIANSSKVGLLFTSKKPRKQLQIKGNSIIYSDYSYESFERFSLNLIGCFNRLFPILNLKDNSFINKIGLRKISSIQINPIYPFGAALSIFNSTLFSTARSGLLTKEGFKGSEETIVQDYEGKLCILKTFLRKKEVDMLEATLDFDLVSTNQIEFKQAIQNELAILNNTHFSLFMWAITPDMIKVMGGSSNAAS